MMGALDKWWDNAASVLAVLTPLVAVPVAIVAIHLRTIREAQSAGRNEVAHRLAALESAVDRLRRALGQFERDHATKEEWLRESMAARRHIERLSEAIVRLETETEHTHALARRVDAAARAVIALHDRELPREPDNGADTEGPAALPDTGTT